MGIQMYIIIAPLFATLVSAADGEQICGRNGVNCADMARGADRGLTPIPISPSPKPSISAPKEAVRKRSSVRMATAGITDRIARSQAHPDEVKSNLPDFYRAAAIEESKGIAEPQFLVFQNKQEILKTARAGSYFVGVVSQALRASPSTPNPLIATITDGRLKGYTLMGDATFGRELKCILLGFTLLKSPDGSSTWALRATGLAPFGEACIEGEYELQTGRFFFAELLMAGGATVVDATVPRTQNALGNYVEEPSVGNAAKKGLSTSLSKTAEHAAEQLKSAPEWTRLPAFQEIRILFQTDPTET